MPDLLYKNSNLHYTDAGKGQAVVLLHGFLEDTGMWQKLTADLEANYRVISPDLLGHGKTGNLGYIHTMETQAEMLKFLLDFLKIETCTLIGHSMGGYISLAFADLYPDRLVGLCLMNSTSMADNEEKKINRDRAIEAVKHYHKTFIRLAIPNLFSEANRQVYTNDIKKITKDALKMSPQGIIAALEGMKLRNDRTHILRQISFPVLLIIGKQDPALDFNSLLALTKIEQVEAVVFNDGHMSHIENEIELCQTIKSYLQERLDEPKS